MERFVRLTMGGARLVNKEDVPHNFSYTRALLVLLGYGWWDPPGPTVPRIIRVFLYPSLYFCLFIFTTIVTLHKPFTVKTETKLDFTLSINSIIVSFTFLYSAFKTVYMSLSADKMKKLINELNRLGEDSQLVIRERNKALAASVTYFGIIGLTIVLWSVYFYGYHGVFPFLSSYPWDDTTPIGNVSAFGVDLVCAIFCGLVHCAVDSIVPMSVSLIRGHAFIIQGHLTKVGKPGVDPDLILNFIIDLHVKILRLSRQLNDCFSVLYSVQSVYTVMHACILIFSVVKGGDYGGGLPMLASAYAQLFLYSFYGQLLTNCFSDLSFACYNNKWYSSQIHVQKTLRILALVSQKPVYLRGLGFTFKASFASYLSSLQDSVSYFLVLKTVTQFDE